MAPRTFGSFALSALVALVALAGAGCESAHPVAPDGASAGVSDFSLETAFCVDEINRLRASIGVAPLTRSERIDSFSREAARVDGQAKIAHKHFRQTNGGNGTVLAETMIPWWQLESYGNINTLIRTGLTQMWSQGPGGPHYETMRGPYTEIGCGVFVSRGEVTVSQDFR